MKKHYLICVVSIMFILTTSCSKEQVETADILGTWTVTQSDDQGLTYDVELIFNDDNSYDWTIPAGAQGHSDSHAEFELIDNIMTIVVDPDCAGEGKYNLILDDDKLAIISIEDACEARIHALEYVWTKK